MVAEPKTPHKPKRAKRQLRQLSCPDCGQTGFDNPQRLGAHRRHKHPGSAAKPVSVPTPAAPAERPHVDPSPTIAGKVFACSECEHEEPNIRLLQRHTFDAHQRALLKSEERTPVEPLREAS